ncbi:GFA family protein [Gilvimarinus chinensis]|uniref:GFA family protein n=1 Tax=Gilvimarinus chinensis TaxID=396005 RepID=UPI0003799923|nr:GFA family protein [Gilvimarinus chinensis]
MKLEGSCHCGSVHFSVSSKHPYPFNNCYCSICRKTAGGGGYAINLGGDFDSLKVEGEKFISVYKAIIKNSVTGDSQESPGQRNFCSKCGSALWQWDPRWPELVHPFASAIDTDLPFPPERTHMMLGSKAKWVEIHPGPNDKLFEEYPQESLAEWHLRIGNEGRNA